MATVIAWHGDPDLKAAAVARMRQHAEHDRLIRGAYLDDRGSGPDWVGCLHGCLTAETLAAERGVKILNVRPDDWHAESERLWGIPQRLGRLLDHLYEDSQSPAGELAVQILEAIPVGADLAPVTDLLMLDLLVELHHDTAPGSDQRTAVWRVVELFARRLAGDEPTLGEWRAAADAADAAEAVSLTRSASHASLAAAFAIDEPDLAADRAGSHRRAWWQQQVLRRIATADQTHQTDQTDTTREDT